MRQYQPLWEAIKLYPKAETVISAPIKNHKRIIQAVKKEKAKDSGWRLIESEKGKRFILTHTILGKKITFVLEEKPLDTMVTL